MQVTNTVTACEAALQRGVEELSTRLADMAAQVERATDRFEEVRDCTDQVEMEVTDEVRQAGPHVLRAGQRDAQPRPEH